MQPKVNKGLNSLAIIERQYFLHQFQDTTTKMSLLDSLVKPTVLYGSTVWGPSLLEFDWAFVERVQTLFLRRIIKCHRFSPHNIVLAEFGAHPFRLGTIFDLVWLLHWLRSFTDSSENNHKYSYLAYCSSM